MWRALLGLRRHPPLGAVPQKVTVQMAGKTQVHKYNRRPVLPRSTRRDWLCSVTPTFPSASLGL